LDVWGQMRKEGDRRKKEGRRLRGNVERTGRCCKIRVAALTVRGARTICSRRKGVWNRTRGVLTPGVI